EGDQRDRLAALVGDEVVGHGARLTLAARTGSTVPSQVRGTNQFCITIAMLMSPARRSCPLMNACWPFSWPVIRRRKFGSESVSLSRAGAGVPLATVQRPSATLSW